MKKLFFVIAVLIAAICVLLFWRHADTGGASSEPSLETTASPSTQKFATNKSLTRPPNSYSNSQNSPPPTTTTNIPVLPVGQRVQAAVSEMNLPVNFWGKVVDQNGAPIPGVQVELSVRQWESRAGRDINGQSSDSKMETDASGRFELTGQSGDVLEIKGMKKEGYRLSPKAMTALNYGRTTNPPTPDNPVIFTMWKVGPKEPLITGSKFFGIVPDGRVYTIDLVTGTKVEGESTDGDLRVEIMRPQNLQPHQHYDWDFTIQGLNGGVTESADEFMYMAPDNGYKPTFQLKFTASQEDWADQCKRSFYIRSRNGAVYGRMEVEVIANYREQSVFSINYAVNPNGSKNLEPPN